MLDGYYYCLNCHSEITPDYNEHCCFCGSAAVAVSGDYSPEEVETAFDLLNKQQQGLVIVPPCKVGDTVYYLSGKYEKQGRKKVYVEFVDKAEVDNIVIGQKGVPQIDVCNDENEWTTFDSEDDFGRIVFLTREEAEQALEEKL